MSHKLMCILLVITLLDTFFVLCAALDRRFLNDTIPPEELIRMMEGVKKTRYLLRNRSNNQWFSLSRRDPIPENIWVSGGDVKLIIHGYTFKEWQTTEEKIGEQGIFDLGIAYSLKNASSNVILLDWTILSTEPISRYFEAAQSTRFIGRDAALFLVRLAKEGYITDWDRVHIIGFSLGGHTVGVVGHEVQELAGSKIGRITGLDPAGPLFDIRGEMPGDLTRFLDKEDGKFVDIIHCNMRVPPSPIVGFLGSCLQAGHVDFYRNTISNYIYLTKFII
ncbi:unnamed protein product [Orchesella dallaii]|uniref:Lipase domain-containing protein n=1 Tax=Orchesella dallaii TaxID=48710 RepID=A0ABP1REL4_9HEXA